MRNAMTIVQDERSSSISKAAGVLKTQKTRQQLHVAEMRERLKKLKDITGNQIKVSKPPFRVTTAAADGSEKNYDFEPSQNTEKNAIADTKAAARFGSHVGPDDDDSVRSTVIPGTFGQSSSPQRCSSDSMSCSSIEGYSDSASQNSPGLPESFGIATSRKVTIGPTAGRDNNGAAIICNTKSVSRRLDVDFSRKYEGLDLEQSDSEKDFSTLVLSPLVSDDGARIFENFEKIKPCKTASKKRAFQTMHICTLRIISIQLAYTVFISALCLFFVTPFLKEAQCPTQGRLNVPQLNTIQSCPRIDSPRHLLLLPMSSSESFCNPYPSTQETPQRLKSALEPSDSESDPSQPKPQPALLESSPSLEERPPPCTPLLAFAQDSESRHLADPPSEPLPPTPRLSPRPAALPSRPHRLPDREAQGPSLPSSSPGAKQGFPPHSDSDVPSQSHAQRRGTYPIPRSPDGSPPSPGRAADRRSGPLSDAQAALSPRLLDGLLRRAAVAVLAAAAGFAGSLTAGVAAAVAASLLRWAASAMMGAAL